MKKKHLIICVSLILLTVVAWLIGYTILNLRVKNNQDRALFEIAKEYIESDESFAAQYGKPSQIKEYEDDIKIIHNKEYQIPCVIETKNGRRYLVWVGFDFKTEPNLFYYADIQIIDGD